MDYNFDSRIPLVHAHSKHILIKLVRDSNFRKLHEWFSELEWDEYKIQKAQYVTEKKVEFQQEAYFES